MGVNETPIHRGPEPGKLMQLTRRFRFFCSHYSFDVFDSLVELLREASEIHRVLRERRGDQRGWYRTRNMLMHCTLADLNDHRFDIYTADHHTMPPDADRVLAHNIDVPSGKVTVFSLDWGESTQSSDCLARAIRRLRDGCFGKDFRNSVMPEYLAATCARAGGLLLALSEDSVDRELLTAAGEIIQALIRGGSAEGIDGYEDAQAVIPSYLGQLELSAKAVEDFLCVNSILGYLDEDEPSWAKRYEAGPSPR
jgi:hypothetical protein